MEKPLLSIITINYNNLDGLKATVASVRNQNFTNFEYFIIDGDSSDGSVSYLEALDDNSIIWQSEPDRGVYNAMNKGIQKSSGEYLLFLNSGDTLYKESSLMEFISHLKFGGDIIYGDYKFDNGEKIYPDHLTPLFFVRSSLPHQSTFFHRRVFEEVGFYDESYQIVADRLFYLKCFLTEKYKFVHIDCFLVKFNLSGMSHNVEYQIAKKKEDTRMFRDQLGIFYEDYMKYLAMEQELYRTRRNTLKGIVKRIKRRLFR